MMQLFNQASQLTVNPLFQQLGQVRHTGATATGLAIQELQLSNLNGAKEYGCSPTFNPRIEQYFYKSALAVNVDDPKKMYMKINGKMHEIDQGTRQGILKYDLLISHDSGQTTSDDVIKLTCGELASLPFGKLISGAKIVKGPECQFGVPVMDLFWGQWLTDMEL